jgi:hypothetical protein
LAVPGQATAYAPGGKVIEKEKPKKTVAIGIMPDGTFSIAVVTKKSSFAESGITAGNYLTFSGNNLTAAAKAAASAFAKATSSFAVAGAYAKGWGTTKASSGWTSASASSRANACVGNCSIQHKRKQLARILANCVWAARQHKLYCNRIN